MLFVEASSRFVYRPPALLFRLLSAQPNRFAPQFVEALQPIRKHRIAHRAPRFRYVLAITKAAELRERRDFIEDSVDRFLADEELYFPQSRRIDHRRPGGQKDQLPAGGGVPPAKIRFPHGTRSLPISTQQPIQHRRLPRSTRSEQDGRHARREHRPRILEPCPGPCADHQHLSPNLFHSSGNILTAFTLFNTTMGRTPPSCADASYRSILRTFKSPSSPSNNTRALSPRPKQTRARVPINLHWNFLAYLRCMQTHVGLAGGDSPRGPGLRQGRCVSNR